MSQPEFILHDGKFLPAGSLLVGADNRCFRYGDGLFETMRLESNLIDLWPLHMERLYKGLELMHFSNPLWGKPEQLLNHILHLVKLNQHQDAAKVRLQVYSGDDSLKNGHTSPGHYFVQTVALTKKSAIPVNGLVAGIHPHIRKSCDIYSQIKSCNFLPYSQAAIHAKEKGWDECLVLNQYDRICDASVANVFWVKNNEIFTPPISEGPVAGVFRRHLLQLLDDNGQNVKEYPLDTETLLHADEVFVTNAVKGLQPITTIGEKNYGRGVTTELLQFLSG
jgi:branched-chain amino acid aminotransferase